MIYTKGKAGYYMGNTDIVTVPLSDANEKNTTEHSTIFDDCLLYTSPSPRDA